MEKFTLLCLGDTVGQATLDCLRKNLGGIRKKYAIDIVVANGENIAEGNGIMPDDADELFMSGVDLISGGNHTWQKNRIYSYLDDKSEIIRPANYPASCPGTGYTVYDCGGLRILFMNIMGNVFMEALDSPFDTADKILEKEKGKYDISLLDFHAEATAEKKALGYYLDGRVDVIFGTHTHVTTADEQILPKGSAYITDVGMCGCEESALGVDVNAVISKFRTKMPTRFVHAVGNITLNGLLVTFTKQGGMFKPSEVMRFRERF